MLNDAETARQFLEDNDLKQADIAREMGMPRQNLHRYLNGRTPPAGFWANFRKAGDKLRKSILTTKDPIRLFYENCHQPHEYYWPKAMSIASMDPAHCINDDCFGTRLVHLRNTTTYSAIDFRCRNWKCEKCTPWLRQRWQKHIEILMQREQMPDCMTVLQFADKDWRYIRDRITSAGGEYIRVMVGRETYRVYATNLPNARNGAVEPLFQDIQHIPTAGFQGRPRRITASRGWALARASRESNDWELVRILGGIGNLRVKQAAEELGATSLSWNTFLFPPDKIPELISKVQWLSNNPQGAEEESCQISTMEGHLLPPLGSRGSPSELLQPELPIGLGLQGR